MFSLSFSNFNAWRSWRSRCKIKIHSQVLMCELSCESFTPYTTRLFFVCFFFENTTHMKKSYWCKSYFLIKFRLFLDPWTNLQLISFVQLLFHATLCANNHLLYNLLLPLFASQSEGLQLHYPLSLHVYAAVTLFHKLCNLGCCLK